MPQRLNRSDLRQIGRVTDADNIAAQEWWHSNAPPEYRRIFEALRLSAPEEIPRTDEEFYQWLREQYPADGGKRSRLRALWAAGLLFFTIGSYYYTRARTVVSPAILRGALDRSIESSRGTLQADCLALRNGEISLLQWQTRMVAWIKATQIAGAILAAGGFSRITSADWDIVNRNIDEQLNYLSRMSRQIAAGLPLDGNICRRMYMYLQSGRRTYHDIEATRFGDRGYTQYRNVLTPAEHCVGCLVETGRGWVPLGDLVPIGARDCMTNCKCYYAYRNPTTGEVDARI